MISCRETFKTLERLQQTNDHDHSQKQEQLIVPVRRFGTGNLICPSQAMRTDSVGHWDHVTDPGIFS